MCGIAGIAHAKGAPPDHAVLDAMTDAMVHRGPDARGVDVFSGRDGSSVGLGHRRLAIIDLSQQGRQPLSNEDGTVWVTFNGEIYNYKELRKELEDAGHRFRSRTDTEVIVHAYEQWGVDAVSRLQGMFAFAVWDGNEGRLLLARDRFGKKPLYTCQVDGKLLFASELPALLEHPDVPREIDEQGLSRYLLYEYVPAPHCILKGVRKLPAGSLMLWRAGEATVAPYWTVEMGRRPWAGMEVEEATRELESRFRSAVERRLMSDVPLGVFLSGGIDSSAVVAFMAELMPAEQIRTFAIGFREASFDESPFAREVAGVFGTNHSERLLREEDLLQVTPEALATLSEPMADSSLLPTYLLSAFTREHVTVALGGDGGDELFAGYDPFAAIGPARFASLVPRPLRAALAGLVGLLPASEQNMSLEFKLKQFLKGMDYAPDLRIQAWMGAFCPSEQHGLLQSDLARKLDGFDPFEDVTSALTGQDFRDDVDRMSYFYQRFYMAGHILPKVDTASMANSLEVRAPFLDAEVAEFAAGLPSALKLRGGQRKWLVKHILRDRLPEGIVHRSKKGFGIPLAKWLKGGLRHLVEEYLSEARLERDGLFNPVAVRTLVDQHMTGRRDNRKQLWTLLVFMMWKQRVVG